MNILVVNKFAFTPLVSFFEKKGVEVDIFQTLTKDIRFSPGWKLKLPFFYTRDFLLFAIQNLLKKYDLIHINGAYVGAFPLLLQKRYILHCQGSDVRRNLYHKIFGPITKIGIKKANKVLFSTPDLYTHIKKIRNDAVFLPNPIDTDKFKPLKVKRENLRILIGKLTMVKGARIIVEALRILRKKFPDIHISSFSIGKRINDPSKLNPLDNTYLAVTDKEIDELKLHLLPRIPHKRMPVIFNEYDIVIGQFIVGTLGLFEFEAMACEKPVVAYFNYPEWYEEPPPIISVNKPKEIVQKVSELIENKNMRRKIGKESRKWIKRFHSVKVIGNKLMMIYESVL